MSSNIIQNGIASTEAAAKAAMDGSLASRIGAELAAGKSWTGAKVDAAIDEGEALLGQARDTAKTASARAGAMASDLAGRAGAEASDLGERAYARAGQAGSYAEAQIRERPLTVLLLAALVGGVVGRFLWTRR